MPRVRWFSGLCWAGYGTLALGLFFVLYSRVGYIRAFFLLSVLINFSNDGCIALALVLIEWLQAK